MKIIRAKIQHKIDKTHYDQIFQLDFVPNENIWSIDSCTLVIPFTHIKMGKNPLTSSGGRFIEDQVNEELILLNQREINGHWFEGKYQDYYVFKAVHNMKRVLCININSKLLGKYYYLGISKKTFPIVVRELNQMFKNSIVFLNDWFKHSYFLDVEFKRDTNISVESAKKCLNSIALSAEGSVKKFYKGQRNTYSPIDERLLTGIANTHYTESTKRSSKSKKNAFWHVYIKNFQMDYAHILKKGKNIDRVLHNYNGHYKMLKECGRPMDLVLRLEVNMGSSKLMETLGVDKSIMNILSLSSDDIERHIIKPLLRGKFSNYTVVEEPKERVTIDFRILYEIFKEKVFRTSMEEAKNWLRKYISKSNDISQRTFKSFKDRVKVFENRFRYEEEMFKLDQNDLFAVFGKDLGREMIVSKIPKIEQIRAFRKRTE